MDACWALSYLSDGTNEYIKAVIESGVVKRLVELLNHQSVSVQTLCVRTVGNITAGDDIQTQHIINCSALSSLLKLLNSPHKYIRKGACRTVSNVTAGNREQITIVSASPMEASNLIQPLIKFLIASDFDIRKEAAWAIFHAISGGTSLQIKYIVDQGCIDPLYALLAAPDARIISAALEGLENILRVGLKEKENSGAEFNDYARAIEAAGGLDKIEFLQSQSNQDVFN